MGYLRNNIIVIPAAALFCSGMILLAIYPYRPNSILSWVVLFLLSLPIVIGFEVIGEKSLGDKYISKLSRTARIFYGVIVLFVVVVVSSIIVISAEPYLSKWGT